MNKSTSLLLMLVACSAGSGPDPRSTTRGATGATGAAGSMPPAVGGGPSLVIGGGAQVSEGGAAVECASVSQSAQVERRPADIIFIIDNSHSMIEEIKAVQERINLDLAKILEDAGVDYRVIMLSHWQQNPNRRISTGVCISPPLGKVDCKAGPFTVADLENPPRFFQYSVEVGSQDGWCDLLNFWSLPDQLEHGTGIAAYLREGSFKHIVLISDDTTRCSPTGEPAGDPLKPETITFDSVALSATGGWYEDRALAEAAAKKLDARLLALSPEHFGTAGAPSYRFHSIVGLAANSPANQAWPPDAALQTATCGSSVVWPGLAHQALSRLTGGLRYPICQSDDFGAIFNAIADTVVVDAKLSCEWAIPAPPPGQTLDYAKVNLEYQPAGAGAPEIIPKVESSSKCGSDAGWFYDREVGAKPEKVVVCPASCEVFKAAEGAGVNIAFGCDTKVSVR